MSGSHSGSDIYFLLLGDVRDFNVSLWPQGHLYKHRNVTVVSTSVKMQVVGNGLRMGDKPDSPEAKPPKSLLLDFKPLLKHWGWASIKNFTVFDFCGPSNVTQTDHCV